MNTELCLLVAVTIATAATATDVSFVCFSSNEITSSVINIKFANFTIGFGSAT